MLSSSSLVPEAYQGRIDNCLVALELSHRIGASPLMVMQNLHIIQGKPSWSSPYIIGSINTCGKYPDGLKFRKSGEGDSYGYEAYAKTKSGEIEEGPKVDWKMVKAEKWLDKNGSKWKTMPELMFRYRAAAFFGRLYCPDILMGMQSLEEVIDVQATAIEAVAPDKEKQRKLLMIADAKTVEDLQKIEEFVTEDVWDDFEKKMTELRTDPAQTDLFEKK